MIKVLSSAFTKKPGITVPWRAYGGLIAVGTLLIILVGVSLATVVLAQSPTTQSGEPGSGSEEERPPPPTPTPVPKDDRSGSGSEEERPPPPTPTPIPKDDRSGSDSEEEQPPLPTPTPIPKGDEPDSDDEGSDSTNIVPPSPRSLTIKIERIQPSVTEGDTVSFKLTATSAPSSRIDINVRVTESGDFLTGTVPDDIALAQGNTVAWLILQTENDNVNEGDGSVTGEIRTGSDYNVGRPSSQTVPVIDDDRPTIKIERTQTSVTEGSTISFKLTANRAPPSRIDINVRVTQSGNFLMGTIPTDIALAGGNTVAWLILQTEDDNVIEGDGSVTGEIWTGSGYYVGSPSSQTVTVIDPDQPPPPPPPSLPEIKIEREQSSVTEGNTVYFKLTATSAPSSRIDINVRVTQSGNFLTGMIPDDIALAQGKHSCLVNPRDGGRRCTRK